MKNKYRNEIEVILNSNTYVLRATFACIVAIEGELDANIIPIIRRMSAGDLGIGEIATIIYHGAQAAGSSEVSREFVGEAIMAKGLAFYVDIASEFLTKALEGYE